MGSILLWAGDGHATDGAQRFCDVFEDMVAFVGEQAVDHEVRALLVVLDLFSQLIKAYGRKFVQFGIL